MGATKDRSIELLTEVLSTHRLVGAAATKKALVEARKTTEIVKKHDRVKKRLFDFVRDQVCVNFNVTPYDLKHGTKHGPRTDALKIAFVTLTRVIPGLKSGELAIYFKKERANISRDIGKFNQLDDKLKASSQLITFCNELTEKAEIFYTAELAKK